MRRVLVVSPDSARRRALERLLAREADEVRAVDELAVGLRAHAERSFDLVFCDLDQLRGRDGDELGRLRESAATQVIAIGDEEASRQALEVMGRRASDCLLAPEDEPIVAAQLALALHRARAQTPADSGGDEVPAASETPAAGVSGPIPMVAGMVGDSPAMKEVFKIIEKFAQHKAGVLIRGESGTGKELVARAIHDLGPRAKKPFIAVNCGAIPANLLESELFGHRRGAFTDAVRDKAGLFQEANSGTLFLDEIGELPLNLQVKLLRAIQEEEVRRIGDTAPTKVDVRVIAATLRDLSSDVLRGQFREDLFYRLNVLPIMLPPLRDRPSDIPLLVEFFLREHNAKPVSGREVRGVSAEAMELLVRYPWPGNVRELENAIERAMVLCDRPLIESRMFEEKLREYAAPAPPPDTSDQDASAGPRPLVVTLPAGELSIKKAARILEEELIRRALAETGGKRNVAAKRLEISHRALLYKIKEFGL